MKRKRVEHTGDDGLVHPEKADIRDPGIFEKSGVFPRWLFNSHRQKCSNPHGYGAGKENRKKGK
jgi:hypothetical protein